MGVFLKNIYIKGIKNIDKAIEISFFKKEIKAISELQSYNVKAIYGPNGSGKTAIVHAFELLDNLMKDKGYLYKAESSQLLGELINKVCKRIDIKVEFFYYFESEFNGQYIYEVTIQENNGGYEISQERFSYKKKEHLKNVLVFESIAGKINATSFSSQINSEMTNLLSKRSFGDILFDLLIRESKAKGGIQNTDPIYLDLLNQVFPIFDFAGSLRLFLDSNDNHIPAIQRNMRELKPDIKSNDKYIDFSTHWKPLGYSNYQMSSEELKQFKKDNVKQEKFIKIFKPEIKSLDIVDKLITSTKNNKTYLVNRFVNYGDYSIDMEFESVGIKKLLDLFFGIEAVINGNIFIVDELDAHINDIYLINIVKYISEYAKGQLIFTTHNNSPMEVLKTKKMSIDFMSSSAEITSWKQVGNYSPLKLYQKGMISGLPFNLGPEDFLEVFSADEQ